MTLDWKVFNMFQFIIKIFHKEDSFYPTNS